MAKWWLVEIALLSPVWVESLAHVYYNKTFMHLVHTWKGTRARGSDSIHCCDQPMAQVRRYRTYTRTYMNTLKCAYTNVRISDTQIRLQRLVHFGWIVDETAFCYSFYVLVKNKCWKGFVCAMKRRTTVEFEHVDLTKKGDTFSIMWFCAITKYFIFFFVCFTWDIFWSFIFEKIVEFVKIVNFHQW